MSDDAPKLPVVTAAVTPTPIPEGFSIPGVVALAQDLAIGMYEEAILLKKHGITEGQYATLKTIPYFQNYVVKASEEWNAPGNAQQRLATQAAAGLEHVLPDVIARAKIKNEPLQGVAQLVKVLADICGAIGPQRQQAAATEKFKITINLGADTEVYDKSKFVTIETDVADPRPVAPVTDGLSRLLALQTEPEQA